MNIISLGAGVQSSTMALMAAHGEITPMPDAAIFADTQWEPRAVYDWLGFLVESLPFPVCRVTKGSLRDVITKSRPGRSVSMPLFIDTGTSAGGIARRQCTREYKIEPITKKVRDLLGYRPRQVIPTGAATMWIGISTDEAVRMKDSRERWQINRWPLIEKRMSRNDCLQWMKRHGYPQPAKSSCIGCPYHSNAHWRNMKNNDPVAWADAVDFDRTIRSGVTFKEQTMRGKQYVHRSLVPLADVDLSTDEDWGQINMFENECEGMCGV